MNYKLHLGDCRTVLATLDDASIDAIVCDPPYEWNFMGRIWDNSGIAYDVTVWQQCYRVLKPGGHLIAFGGSRTYHRLAVAIEDAGFEIRDQIQWIYGSGFPKSLDVSKAMDKQAGVQRSTTYIAQDKNSIYGHGKGKAAGVDRSPGTVHTAMPATDLAKQWQGWGTALKPAHEPAVLARKPLCGTVADNVTAWGVGALNIDGTRVGTSRPGTTLHPFTALRRMENRNDLQEPTADNRIDIGRWPANIILDEEAAQILDEQSGERKSGNLLPHHRRSEQRSIYGKYEGKEWNKSFGGDSGGASRFFYVAKSSNAEREAGLDGMGLQRRAGLVSSDKDGGIDPLSERWRTSPRANHHPTVKPIALMRYLVRMVTPKGGKVLDPFMGSGSTGCAAVLEGCDFVGIDITPEYVAIAQKRIAHYAVETPLEGM